MSALKWLGLGAVAALVLAAVVVAVPLTLAGNGSPAAAVPSTSASDPAWGAGNLCTSSLGDPAADFTCVSTQSFSTLWLNLSSYETEHVTETILIVGSFDCINLNFHSFYSTIVINLEGSSYSCPAIGDSNLPSPGLNIAINSEGDSLTINQLGSYYSSNVVVYGTTTFVSAVQYGSHDTTTVTYVGTTAGFATCPSGIVYQREKWSEVSFGSVNTFNTIFVDGSNVAHPPADILYTTTPLAPPDGLAFGTFDSYGVEVTTTSTPPAGTCSYL